MKILKLKHDEIDFERYNQTILQCTWSKVYAFSWYLDIVSPNWELLCYEDYSVLMPLPVKSKFGIKYILPPYFCQQLGVFASFELNKNQVLELYNNITQLYVILQTNTYDNEILKLQNKRTNFFINSANYYEQSMKYSKNTLRNLKKAESLRNICKEISLIEYLDFIKREASDIYTQDLQIILEKIIIESLKLSYAKLYASTINDEICAVAFIVDFNNRLYNLAPASSAKGKESQSMAFLIDFLIKQACESGKIFDFEGSSILGVAKFYQGFGAEAESFGIFKKFLWKTK